ncbi:MAG: hypothetical protein IJZ68_07500 [Bacteroidaceae bacterium]|nr:hypothetical protein [Bacteroidaceae bacterium]
MGLDNGFQLRSKKTGKTVDLFHFRKYYELAEYFRSFKMLPKFDGTEGASYLYPVTEENLTELKRQLQPIYDTIVKLPENTISYYDEMGYPQKYTKLFYGNDFDPTSSQSAFAGAKLIRLYQRVNSLLEVLDNFKYACYNDTDDTYEIIFYDSY